MSKGGMLQRLSPDGWKDTKLLGYKDSKEATAIAFYNLTNKPVRIVDKNGKILFEYPPDSDLR